VGVVLVLLGREAAADCELDPDEVWAVPANGTTEVATDLQRLWIRSELRVDDLWLVFDGATLEGALENTTWWVFDLPELAPGESYEYEAHFQVFGEERVAGPLSFTLSGTAAASAPAPIVVEAVKRWTNEEVWGGSVPANDCGGASLDSRLGQRCREILWDQGCWDVGPWLEFTIDLEIDPEAALYGIGPEYASGPWHVFPGDCRPETFLESQANDVCVTEQCFRIYAYDHRGLLAQETTVCEDDLDFGEAAETDDAEESDSGPNAEAERAGCSCRASGTTAPMVLPGLAWLLLCGRRSRTQGFRAVADVERDGGKAAAY
jgi:hypothetical protein